MESHRRVEYYIEKYFRKKEELNMEKMKMKIFSFLCKILIAKTSILSDHENVVFILIYKIFPKI